MMRGVKGTTESRRDALATCALSFGAVAGLAYVAQRAAERLASGAAEPMMNLRSPLVAFYWRGATATFWGGLAAIVVWLILSRGVAPESVAKRIGAVALPAALIALLLSWLLP